MNELGLSTELKDRRNVFYCSVGDAWKVRQQAQFHLFLALTLLKWLLVAFHSLRNVCVQRSSWDAFVAKVAATAIRITASSV